ncbi:RDD family protein [Sphingomonas sp. URHD0057]|uniref:RDD family protein n=1 Tax=Sphingomonas sp. URHD0057 TaxID=1380389 RepID=UPI00048DE09B|nr:RDD family protein [Sphingomonas sp. URHD0057]
MATRATTPKSLRRTFITPEGVDLRLELGSAGSRAAAFIIDLIIMVVVLVVATLGLLYLFGASLGGKSGSIAAQIIVAIWLIGFFILRNGWFSLFEMGGRGATPGKRLLGLRVVARDGARLTGSAVIARNAMREIEVFLPLSFLGDQVGEGTADTFLIIFALVWSGIFLFFPLFNRDRLRVGDLVAGTWVVQAEKGGLSEDLVGSAVRARRTFSKAALELYGVYELQTLEDVLRKENPDAIATVARMIRAKGDIVDDGDDYGFLSDYYAALCAHLEAGLMVGRRRDSKFA